MFPLRLVAGRGADDSSPPPPQLSEGTKVALKAAGFAGGRALAEKTAREVRALHGIGPKRLEEIVEWLGSHGLRLKDAPIDAATVANRCRDTWATAWNETQPTKYPWEIPGADVERSKRWAIALGMPDDMDEAVQRLDHAIRCYFDAAKAGTAWPQGDAPSTRGFCADLTKWILAGDRRPAEASTPRANPFDARRATEGRFKRKEQA